MTPYKPPEGQKVMGNNEIQGAVNEGAVLSAQRGEVSRLREDFVKRHIAAVLDPLEGDFSDEQYNAVDSEAHRTWRSKYPNLNNLLFPHGPVSAGGSL